MKSKFEALLVEETCGKTHCGEYYLITVDGVPFAKVVMEVNDMTTNVVQKILDTLHTYYDN